MDRLVPYTIPAVQQNTLGNIAYEITNYLGNVNVVISDRKLWVPATGAFKACVVSRTDYFPFGMEISSRTSNSDNYRFGYNGMESDNETKGSGNSYTTEFRQYDPRLGRWLSLDPLMAEYPMMSPYVAFNNNPIYFVDPLGLEGEPVVGSKCYDEIGTKLEYEGDGNWKDVTPIIELSEVKIRATQDFQVNGGKPKFEFDHGHCQDYPEIGYVYDGQRKPTFSEKVSEAYWNTKAAAATIIRWDLGNALPAYRHFQDASGSDYYFDFEDYFDDDPSALILQKSVIDIAKKSAEKLSKTNKTISMTSRGFAVGNGDDRFPYPESEDWQKALGAFNFYMTAKVTSKKVINNTFYTMIIVIHAEDRYNFNPGMNDIATGTPDGDNGIFEITGLGKEFLQYGKHTITISWLK